MKTAFKKSLAFVMMLCMLLGTVSAFAAGEDYDMSALKKADGLKQGDKGQVVRALTYQLKAHGYLAVVSNNFDNTVKTALSRFQYDNGYLANGVANKKTIDLLLSGRGLTTTNPTLRPEPEKDPIIPGSERDLNNLNKVGDFGKGTIGAAVRTLIARLKKLEYLEEDFVPKRDGKDGLVGNQTFDATVEAAVKKFQENHGIKATGVVDSLTKSALNWKDKEIVRPSGPVKTVTPPSLSYKEDTKNKQADNYMGNLKVTTQLKKGDEGQSVRALTYLLQQKGYLTNVSSKFSSSVATALKKFQYNNGYADTGIADQKTIKLLLAGTGLDNPSKPVEKKNDDVDTNADSYMGNLKAQGSVAPGAEGQIVRALTYLLSNTKDADGNKYLDYVSSTYGPKVKAAVARYQADNGLAETGIANYATVAKLLGSK